MHILEENWSEFLFNLGAEKSFLTRTQNTEAKKIKTDKFDYFFYKCHYKFYSINKI